MWRAQIREEKSRLEEERQIKCKGTARIRLKWLHFQWNQPRELDRTNVERLKKIFRKDCRRLEVLHHIPAVIEQQILDDVMQLSGTAGRQLGGCTPDEYPDLIFPARYQLECLHGRHRIQAAKELGLEWWTVDLYIADVDLTLRTYLAEEYANEEKPSDGEIYRKIRQYHFQQNLRFEWRWWSRLGQHGTRCLKQLLRHEEVAAALDALCGIPGLWGGMNLHTWHTILAINCDDVIVRYLRRIKDLFGWLLQGDPDAMLLVDQNTVEQIELKAPQVSTMDAKALRGQVLGGLVFSAFSDEARAEIWARLQTVDGLIPSLFTFFKDVHYLEVLAHCITRLVTPSPGDSVSTALFKSFSDVHQKNNRAVIQVTESSFCSSPASSADRADLGVRQLYAYAMRHYLQLPRERKGNELVARHTTYADPTVLREFADLAERLGFESPEITTLKRYSNTGVPRTLSENSKPLLVTDGAGVKKKRRCGLPSIDEYMEDSESLFIKYLHNADEEQSEGITSFFVRRSIYSTFFGKPFPLPLEELHSRDDAVLESQESERRGPEIRNDQEKAREEQAKRNGGRKAQVRKPYRDRTTKFKQKKILQERFKTEGQKREDGERPQDLNLENERRLKDQQRFEEDELFDLDQDKEKQEQERQEQERQEQERQEQEKQEQETQEEERQKEKRQKQERQEQEKQEQEREEQERQQQERQEQERQQQERQEQERQEQERQEQERQEQERQEQERQEQERQEQEREEQERRGQAKMPDGQGVEQEEWERLQISRLEEERRLEDQQRIEQDELLDMDQDLGEQPVEVIPTESLKTSRGNVSNNSTIRVDFKFRDNGIWRSASTHTVNRADSSKIEEVAINWIRRKWRLFNTQLRMLAAQQCLEAVIADDTYTILLIRESEIDIDYELLLSAMKVGVKANDQINLLEIREDFEEIL